jgi:hypothetical protein
MSLSSNSDFLNHLRAYFQSFCRSLAPCSLGALVKRTLSLKRVIKDLLLYESIIKLDGIRIVHLISSQLNLSACVFLRLPRMMLDSHDAAGRIVASPYRVLLLGGCCAVSCCLVINSSTLMDMRRRVTRRNRSRWNR